MRGPVQVFFCYERGRMATGASIEPESATAVRRLMYFGWTQVPLAALAMLATLPGRTHGLGLVTEPLLADLQLDRNVFSYMNLGATLIGALFCLPCGLLIDRFGSRAVVTVVSAGLGAVVWLLAGVHSLAWLFIGVTLTRGLGQSALSVVSISMVSKWFRRRIGLAMGIYSVLIGLSFGAAFKLVGSWVGEYGWRPAWGSMGLIWLFAFAPLFLLAVRSSPESFGVEPDESDDRSATTVRGLTLPQTLRTPAFWVFGCGASVYGLVASGMGLYYQAILEELGFSRDVYVNLLAATSVVSMISQLICGGISLYCPVHRLMALALVLYAAALGALPFLSTSWHIWSYAAVMGISGGVITMVFFAIWGAAFGRAYLGRIQGAAQMLTVLASAVGPAVFSNCLDWTGSYFTAIYAIVPTVLFLAVASWVVKLPLVASETIKSSET